MKKVVLLNLVLALCLVFSTVAFAADDIQGAAFTYFNPGMKIITAAALYEALNDGDPSTDPYIISVRSPEHYALGHIKGARNIPLNELFKAETLATLPTDKKIVVYCYTGQNSSWAVATLNMLGYDAYNLSYGMMGWTKNPDVYVNRFNPANVPNYPTVTETFEATGNNALPTPLADTISGAAAILFSEPMKFIQNAALYENLSDGDESNDPFIISIRSAEHYAKGHINGAVNMDAKTMFSAENLAKLPTDRQIVVYCYTGQTSAQAVAALRLLGYDAWSLVYGMMNWSADPEVFAIRFNPDTVPDYPVEGTAVAAAAAEEETPAAETTPAALPVTGGAAFPIQGLILGLGALSIGLGAALRRRNSA